MNPEKARQFLSKYWESELSLTEEAQLRQYFLSENLPEDLLVYQTLFLLTKQERKIELKVPITKPATKMRQIISLRSIAALLILGLSFSLSYFYLVSQQENQFAINHQEIEDPQIAYQKTKDALLMVSTLMDKGQRYEEHLNDLKHLNKYIQPKQKEI